MENTIVEKNKYIKSRASESIMSSSEILMLAIFALLFLAISFIGNSLITTVALVSLFSATLFIFGTDAGITLYIFSLFCAPLTFYSGYLPVAYCGIILSAWICLDLFSKRNTKMLLKYIVWISIALFLVIRSMYLGEGMTSLTLVYDLIIALYIKEKLKENSRNEYWKKFVFTLFLCSLFSVLIGLMRFSGTQRFTIPIGTDRSGMVILGGMIYPFFYIKNNGAKWSICLSLLFVLFLTVSMTAIIGLFAFAFITYFSMLFKADISSKTRIKYKIIGVICFLIAIVVWQFGTGISAIDRVIDRIKTIAVQVQNEEWDTATTGRTEIWRYYQKVYDKFTEVQKWFGGGLTSYTEYVHRGYCSHNTYLDALYFLGYIPISYIGIELIKAIFERRRQSFFVEFLILKAVFMLTACSVSMLTASYWLIFVLI